MATYTTVNVNLAERGYDIKIGSGLLSEAIKFFIERKKADHFVIITDANVEPLYVEPLVDQLSDENLDVDVMTIEPGESSKTVEMVEELWNGMLSAAADRQSVVIAVGGGVVGDLAGFAAAGYARGIGFIQVPTTLLAQVDSSVGGKTGVNLPEGKNMVGAFWQPLGVLIDVDVLESLPEREYIAGLAEVVKYGVILDEEFFAYLENNVEAIQNRDSAALEHIVARSCRLKADIVEQDEREETGLRSVLNYGHTFGHALESATNYTEILHGEGVSIGMHCAAKLAARVGMVDEAFVTRQKKLLTALKLPTKLPEVDLDEVLHLMRRDKKVADGQIKFVLPTRMGEVKLVDDIAPTDIRAALEE